MNSRSMLGYKLPIEYFSHWVKCIPDQLAVKCEGNALTYHQLDVYSSRIAHALVRSGAKTGARVAVWMPGSELYVAAILGIWKAGAAYVPLEYEAPGARLQYMLKECAPVCALTKSSKTIIHKYIPTISLCDIANFKAEDKFDLPKRRKSCGSDIACIIYTSGSTGKPKGVAITNKALVALFQNMSEKHSRFKKYRNIINVSPFNFNYSLSNIAFFLIQGKVLVVYNDLKNIFRLLTTLQNERINILDVVPTVLGLMLSTEHILERYDLTNLKIIITGGAPCPTKFILQLKSKLPRVKIYSAYGATEVTCECSSMRVDNFCLDSIGLLPLGQPFKNMSAFVVDERGHTVAHGQTGELVLGGPQLMRGYWGTNGKANAGLRNDPRGPASKRKVYYTGDIVRTDESGILHFVGRKDNMIKSGGYRIEPVEIESVLYKHPSIREVAVVPVFDELLGEKLVACFTTSQGQTVDVVSLKVLCESELPRYMIPHKFVALDELPKSSFGKIDRGTLKMLATNVG